MVSTTLRREGGGTLRGQSQPAIVDRPRLIARLRAARGALLVAPGGYGKTTLAAQLADALDLALVRAELRDAAGSRELMTVLAQAWRRAGLNVVADGVSVEDPDASIGRLAERVAAVGAGCVLLVDEIHRADSRAADLLAALLASATPRMRVVLAGRRAPPPLAHTSYAGIEALEGHDLRFDGEEVERLVRVSGVGGMDGLEAALVAAVVSATGSWPAAVSLAVSALRGGATELPTPGQAPVVLAGLVEELLDTAGPAVRAIVEQTAALPLLSNRVAELAAGSGALARLLDAGMPLRRRPDGWWELPDRVREVVGGASRTAPPALTAIAAEYARAGALVEAIGLLARGNDADATVELLAGQPRQALAAAGLHYLDAVLRRLPDDAVAAHPTAIVTLIRAAEHALTLRDAWLRRAKRVLPEEGPLRRAVDAEQALADARAGDLSGAAAAADGVLSGADAGELTTRGRAHMARGLSILLQDTRGATERVREDFEAAIGLFELAGETDWQADAHQALGYGCYFTIGALEAAAERLDRALALRPAPDAARAQTLTFVAEVLGLLGRYDDARVALLEARAIGRRLGDQRSIGYAAWSAAQLARLRRDRAGALAALDEAEAHPDGWFDTLAGIDFLANAAEIRLAVGDVRGARRDLERAEQRAAGTPRSAAPLAARARFEAMHGDPDAASRYLDELEGSPLAYRGDRWLHQLLRAVVAARRGAAAEARSLLEQAARTVAEEGDPERISRVEPQLRDLAAPDPAEPAERPLPAVSIRLLGRFAVERNGEDVTPPAGRPATLVKLLAIRATLTVDEAIDELWADADVQTGRARLRNLLHRVRAASGWLIERHDGGLSLAPGTIVDAARFEADAAAALGAPPAERAALARRALARSTGELLPTDRYADWAAIPRERVRRRHLALLDLVADDALARGDLDEAARLLDQAISEDPLEEQRYVRLARALAAQGRIRRARQVAEAGLAAAADLGVEPKPDLTALLSEL